MFSGLSLVSVANIFCGAVGRGKMASGELSGIGLAFGLSKAGSTTSAANAASAAPRATRSQGLFKISKLLVLPTGTVLIKMSNGAVLASRPSSSSIAICKVSFSTPAYSASLRMKLLYGA